MLTARPRDLLQFSLLTLAIAIVWGTIFVKLANDWSTNPQYEFGFFVPFFIAYLLGRRWSTRPDPSSDVPRLVLIGSGVIALLLLLPIRMVEESNPDWRPLNWLHASIGVALSLVLIGAIGGRRWVRHFVGPFLLVFFALPWPLAIEQAVLQNLTSAVTSVTVEFLNLFNIPALQRGNVIDVATGSVGVEDACSGIRSLAGTLMASAFFGEFFRLNGARRAVLLVCGAGCAFTFNLCRTFFLSWQATTGGVESIGRWHDPAGYTIFLASFASLWLFATFLSRQQTPPAECKPLHTLRLRLHPGILGCVVLWALAVEGITEAWFRYREGVRDQPLVWNVRWPEHGAVVRSLDIPDEARSILRFTDGNSALIEWPADATWQVFFFRWEPGRSSAQLATMHRPEICLPAVGFELVGPINTVKIPLGMVHLPFSGSEFKCNDERMFVYRCLWEDQSVTGAARNHSFDTSARGRIASTWYGRRNLGQRLLQIGILGVGDEQAARENLRRRVPGLISHEG